jgi:hypothetical protein
MVRAPKTLAFEQRIGIARKVPIGEEEQAHDIERQAGIVGHRRIYVSLVDIFLALCHCHSIAQAFRLIPKTFRFAKGMALGA